MPELGHIKLISINGNKLLKLLQCDLLLAVNAHFNGEIYAKLEKGFVNLLLQ